MDVKRAICLIFISLALSAEIIAKPAVDDESETRLKIFRTKYLWTLRNFSLYDRGLEGIESPLFRSKDDPNLRYSLKVHPRGTQQDNQHLIGIYLNCHWAEDQHFKVQYWISLLDDAYNELEVLYGSEICSRNNGTANFVSREDIVRAIQSADDVVNLVVDVWTYKEETEVANNCKEAPILEHSSKLEPYFNYKEFCDVHLVVRDNDTIHAHKIILAAHSPVLASLIKKNSTSKKPSIGIDDFSVDVVKEAVKYLYSGRVDNVSEDLFAFAEKYEIEGLRDICERELCRNLKSDNAVEIFIVADKYEAKELRSQAGRYIVAHVDEFFVNPDYGRSKFKLLTSIYNNATTENVEVQEEVSE